MNHKILTVILAVLIGISLFGCSGGGGGSDTLDPEEKNLISIEIDSDDSSVPLGIDILLAAYGHYNDESLEEITSSVSWISSNPSVASVDDSGTITPFSPGETVITAQFNGMSATITITITEPELLALSISPSSESILEGKNAQFIATGTYTNGSRDVTSLTSWTSSAPEIATITSDGLATGVSAGATTVGATIDGQLASATLIVTEEQVTPPVTLISIILDPISTTIALGNGQQFSATGHYSDSSTQDISSEVTWSSSDSGIASISTSGHVTSVTMGSVQVMAELNGITDEADLVVTDPALRFLDITPQSPSIAAGDTLQFTATGTYSDGRTQDLTSSTSWTSEFDSIATIDGNGLSTALTRGETHITAETGGFSDTILLTVTRGDLVSLTIEPEKPSVEVLEVLNLSAIGRYQDGSEEDITALVTWGSSDENVAQIEIDGLAQGLAEGFSIVTATTLDGTVSNSTLISVCEEGGVVYDNGAPNTSSTGSWANSATTGPYGTESLVSKYGTYTWTFTPEVSGDYDLYMWWTQHDNRRTDVPVAITHEGGIDTVYVDQTTDGSQWNFIGRYSFTTGLIYTVTVTALAGDQSTCADAIKFVEVPPTTTPVADFTASPTLGIIGTIIQFFERSIGTITAWFWDFGDDSTSTDQNPQHQYNTEGSYTVSLTVTDENGTDTKTRQSYINIFTERENIYICDGFDGGAPIWSRVVDMLTALGATEIDGIMVYQNPDTGKTHFIYEVTSPAGMEAALKEEGAHVIFNGHSNYGLGASFTRTNQEQAQVRYVDDDRIVNISTDMVSVSLEGLIFGQAYPNLKPTYKDGTSAIMPYDFDDPRGDPPFNYYITYKIPNDDTLYFAERDDGSLIDRFEGTGKPAWDWRYGEGIPPDPDDPEERLYYITNPAPEYNHFEAMGTWNYAITPLDAYSSYNYQYRNAGGSGANTATWTVVVAVAGYYDVRASWFYATTNATNALYTIVHADGITEVEADQRTAPDGVALQTLTWNSLGQYYFEEGAYTITLCDGADGRIVADSVAFYNVDDPTMRRIRVDNTNLYKSHFTGGYYGSGTILNMEGKTIPEEELQYKRMFYSSCFSGRYFLGKFHRGQMFFTLQHTGGWDNPVPEYLERYLLGQSDQEILAWIKAEVPIYDFYDFDQIPPSMR